MSGRRSGLGRLFQAVAGNIRDKDDNPAKHRIMRSRAYFTHMHTGVTHGDHRAQNIIEWMVARRNIDGSWRVFMESGVASNRKGNRFVMRNTRNVARETDFKIAAGLIRNYETRMAQVYDAHKAAKPTCDHVDFVAPEPEDGPQKQIVKQAVKQPRLKP